MKTFTNFIKRLAILLLPVVALFTACKKDTEPSRPQTPTSICVSEPDLHVGYTEHSVKVLVSSDVAWSVEGMTYWCRVSPMAAGAGTTEITITVAANTENASRSTVISFACDASYKETITVTQSGLRDVAADQTVFDIAAAGGQFKTTVHSNEAWTLTGGADWLTVSPTTPIGTETEITFEAQPNTSIEKRTAVLHFTGEFDTADSIVVNQAGTLLFDARPRIINAPKEGATIRVAVLSNTTFTVSSTQLWTEATISEGSAKADSTIFNVKVAINPELKRTAELKLYSMIGDSTIIIQVNQAGRELYSGNNISSFSFLKSRNPSLSADVNLTIAGDSCVGRIPDLGVDMTTLIPTFSTSERAMAYIGQNKQITNYTPGNYSKRVTYTVIAENGTEHNYTISVSHFTGLPILYINTDTNDEIASKDVWEGAKYRLDGGLNFSDIALTTLQVKGRGNSSWSTFLKKRSYNMKLDVQTAVLGMPKHKRWCLIGNYRDKTLLRNQVSMELGRQTDLKWVPRGVQVELVLNGTHRGTYLVSEQIRIDKDRVNINEMLPTDMSGDAITGGYILEMDMYGDGETYSFYSNYITGTLHTGNSLVHVKSPALAEGNTAQFAYIESHFRKAEEAICNNGGDWSKALSTYIDLGSFVDTWLIYEISATPEPARGPYSFYLYKDKGDSKFYGGPLWDFDFLSYIPSTQTSWVNTTAGWIPYLMKCPQFKATVKAHWDKYKAGFYKVQKDYINSQEKYLKYSAAENWAMFDLAERGENGDEHISSTDAIQRMRTVLKTRLDWLDRQFASWATVGADGIISPVTGDNSDKDKTNFWK